VNTSTIFVKPIEKNDPEATLVAEWLAADAVHKANGITLDDAFADGTETVMVYDDEGPVIAVRFHKALRVAMQFKPDSRIRIAKIGPELLDWLKTLAKQVKCKEVIGRPGGKADSFFKKLGCADFIGRVLGV
jgi:hypothetical protein